ncbi:hypothetical protein TSOC_012198 [Tetrabaena socialis]|uniref:phytol kinase n=1 Tax=Tetrabaena socialis TaxID=47790 RepID=A0A2J7ZNQ2_9CHLO|nr:hypothetical protein TSOC_012198 [Tetrabaena socialis]|eukprot:PNH01880.1 hypothetical protein TSOC_012198 [Tetrabaena socialis]
MLDRSVEDALRRLPGLVDRLMADPEAQFRVDDAEEMVELIATVRDCLAQFPEGSAEGAAAAATILEDAGVHSALLRLVAAVVRWPLLAPISDIASGSDGGSGGSGSSGGGGGSRSGGSGTEGSGRGTGGAGTGCRRGGSTGELRICEGTQAHASVAWKTCGVVDMLLQLLFAQLHVSLAAVGFIQKLLRMDTLQCLARWFAAGADSIRAPTAQQAGFAECLFCMLNSLLLPFQYNAPTEEEALHASMWRELTAALRDSCVLEQAARLLLQLMLQGAPTGAALPMRYPTPVMIRTFLVIYQNIGGEVLETAALREVLSGRCAWHMVLIHGVAALCMADGGPAYGLPENVQQAVSTRLAEAFPPGPQEVYHLEESIPLGLLAALAYVGPSPPVGARAIVMLLLRLARLAVTSGDVWAAHAQQQRAGLPAHAGGTQFVMVRDHLFHVAQSSLEAAWRLLRERLTAHPPAWVEEAGVECWRLVAATLCRNMLCWAYQDELRWVGTQLLHRWVPLRPAGEPLPPAPPPGLAAVLAGGLLPCLERLLRRACEEPDGPESAVMGALLSEGHTWRLWAHLLEYGEPRQAAALVATLGKLLRRANLAEASFGDGRLVSRLCAAVLGPCASPSELIEAEGRQRGRLLMYAVCSWLPALSGLVLQVMADQPASDTADSKDLWGLLRPLMGWLPLLARRCANGSTAGAAAGCSAAAAADAACSPAADDAGGWRLLLLEEVRVVPLLGAALRLAAFKLPRGGLFLLARAALARNCCAVAAAFPDEVLRAASSSAWPPGLLRALLPDLQEQGRGVLVDRTEALAAWLEGASVAGNGSSSGGGRGGFGGSGGDMDPREHFLAVAAVIPGVIAEMAAALVPLAEARALLRTCSYNGCTSLAGDSEADARMRWCRFCNSSCYCCGECQLSHWREGGHKEACPGGAKARPG